MQISDRRWLEDSLERRAGEVATRYRRQARRALCDVDDDRLVEQTALGLFERDLCHLQLQRLVRPGAAPAVGRVDSLAHCDSYVTFLTASLAGVLGALTPSVLQALEGFRAERIFHSEGHTRYLGDCQEAARAGEAVSRHTLPCGVTVLGAWGGGEIAVLEGALEDLYGKVPAAHGLLRTVVLRTYIGESFDEQGEYESTVAGIFDRRRPGEMALLRLQLSDPPKLAHTLFHEAGHELDIKLGGGGGGYRSRQTDTPFANPGAPEDYVSDYARLSPVEDFAETHADLIENWSAYMQEPKQFLRGGDKLSEKRRWILEKGYGMRLPD